MSDFDLAPAVLLAIRERTVRTLTGLKSRFFGDIEPWSCHGQKIDWALESALYRLKDAGLIEIDGNRVAVTPLLGKMQRALPISLNHLSSSDDPDSINVIPAFGPPTLHNRFLSQSASGDNVGESSLLSVKDLDVFVLMEFSDNLTAIYESQIINVCASLRLTVARADSLYGTEPILRDIWSAIYHSRFVIADCTSRNPNVFYEIGIAHAVGRPAILITQTMNDVPFDLRHVRCIVYDTSSEGLKRFQYDLYNTIQTQVFGTVGPMGERPPKQILGGARIQ